MIRRGDLDGHPLGRGAGPCCLRCARGMDSTPHPRATMKVAPTDADGLFLRLMLVGRPSRPSQLHVILPRPYWHV